MSAAGILGQKRSKYQRPILHSSKSPETSRKMFSKYIENIESKNFTRGGTPCPRGWGRTLPPWARPLPRGPPGGLPVAIFSYMESFNGKNHKPSSRTKLHRHEAEPIQGSGRAVLPGKHPSGEGNHCHRHHQYSSHRERAISINIFISTISSQNPSSSLVSNLVSKPQIGTCGLLVVLITPCS